jgi:hypothetical protein
MARSDFKKPGGGSSRPPLEPANPLPARTAVLQMVLLLGIPLVILVLMKFVMRSFFPQLGY